MGNWRVILIRNLEIEYANDRLSLNGRSARLRQGELGCLCVNVNSRITVSTHVIVHAMDFPLEAAETAHRLGAGRTGYQKLIRLSDWIDEQEHFGSWPFAQTECHPARSLQ